MIVSQYRVNQRKDCSVKLCKLNGTSLFHQFSTADLFYIDVKVTVLLPSVWIIWKTSLISSIDTA